MHLWQTLQIMYNKPVEISVEEKQLKHVLLQSQNVATVWIKNI
jgi:hypothetical protein